jgi:predicted small lipoprotein YifL
VAAMNRLAVAVLLLILWALAGCALTGPLPSPPPAGPHDDRGGMD